jgi:hypothetical protein
MTTINVEELKNKIEKMEDIHQLHIGSILRQNPDIKLNSNKSGILVNLTTISENILEEIQKYVDYVIEQEKTLSLVENKTEDLKQQYISILNSE